MTKTRAVVLNARLETERLVLEPRTASHADLLVAGMQDERIYRWISAAVPMNVDSVRQHWGILESRVSPDGKDALLGWAVRQAQSGAYVGKFDADVTGAVATNVGYLFFPEFWNRGYATEALGAVVKHFEQHGITEMRALVTCGNGASERVLVKAGFARTRILPENDMIRGVKYDDIEYVRLAQQ
jgi:[ribosomal protein S5]-alanine N-acetyltransferase